MGEKIRVPPETATRTLDPPKELAETAGKLLWDSAKTIFVANGLSAILRASSEEAL